MGGGDTALEEATFLTRFATEVAPAPPPRHVPGVSKIMRDRALAHPKIEVRWNTAVEEVLGDGQGRRAAPARHGRPAPRRRWPIDGLFVAIGYRPNTEVVPRLARGRRRGLPRRPRRDRLQDRRRVHRRRRARPPLPPGGHRGRRRLQGRHRRRALAGVSRASSRDATACSRDGARLSPRAASSRRSGARSASRSAIAPTSVALRPRPGRGPDRGASQRADDGAPAGGRARSTPAAAGVARCAASARASLGSSGSTSTRRRAAAPISTSSPSSTCAAPPDAFPPGIVRRRRSRPSRSSTSPIRPPRSPTSAAGCGRVARSSRRPSTGAIRSSRLPGAAGGSALRRSSASVKASAADAHPWSGRATTPAGIRRDRRRRPASDVDRPSDRRASRPGVGPPLADLRAWPDRRPAARGLPSRRSTIVVVARRSPLWDPAGSAVAGPWPRSYARLPAPNSLPSCMHVGCIGALGARTRSAPGLANTGR